jgi:hypothetical protein
VKQTYISSSFFVRNTSGAISRVREVIGDVIKTTSQNIGNEDAYGVNINLNMNLSNKLMIGGGADVSYMVLANNNPNPLLNAKNEGIQNNFRIFGNYNMGNGWGAQVFSFYRVNQVQLQGSQGGFGIYSLSLRKDFKNKKGSIGFGAENFLTPNGFVIRNETKTPTLTQFSENTLRNMNFKVNFSYRIGKMSFGPTKKKKSVSNDDTKDGGGDSPAPVQPMMPGMGGGRMGGGGFGGGPR